MQVVMGGIFCCLPWNVCAVSVWTIVLEYGRHEVLSCWNLDAEVESSSARRSGGSEANTQPSFMIALIARLPNKVSAALVIISRSPYSKSSQLIKFALQGQI